MAWYSDEEGMIIFVVVLIVLQMLLLVSLVLNIQLLKIAQLFRVLYSLICQQEGLKWKSKFLCVL